MHTVTHRGRTIAYRRADREGGGDPVLFVHGSGGSHQMWTSQFRLAERPVIAVDLSGHGESDDIDADAGFETRSAYVDDVVAVAEATGARTMVGASLGGPVLLTLALERELQLEALALVGTGARPTVPADLLAWLDEDFDRAVEFLHGPDRLFHDPDEDLLELSRRAMREAGHAVTRRDFRTCHLFDARDRVAGVDVPALAAVGEHDGLTPPRYHEFLAAELPDCDLAVVEDAAHLPMLERPDAFNGTLRTFLDRV